MRSSEHGVSDFVSLSPTPKDKALWTARRCNCRQFKIIEAMNMIRSRFGNAARLSTIPHTALPSHYHKQATNSDGFARLSRPFATWDTAFAILGAKQLLRRDDHVPCLRGTSDHEWGHGLHAIFENLQLFFNVFKARVMSVPHLKFLHSFEFLRWPHPKKTDFHCYNPSTLVGSAFYRMFLHRYSVTTNSSCLLMIGACSVWERVRLSTGPMEMISIFTEIYFNFKSLTVPRWWFIIFLSLQGAKNHNYISRNIFLLKFIYNGDDSISGGLLST